MEPKVNAQLLAAFAQYVQEFQPANARKPVTANRDLPAFVNNVNVIPDFASADDPPERRLVTLFQIREGLVGKDDAPAERVVRSVAFDNDDFARRILALHQDGEI